MDCEFKLAILSSMTCSLKSLLPSSYDPLSPLVCHAYLVLSPLVFGDFEIRLLALIQLLEPDIPMRRR